jgi:hypothetical protein
VFHQYFGCGVLFNTYRDTWLDEAITVWYTEEVMESVDAGFRSDMVGFASPTTNEFNLDAYSVGPEIIQRLAIEAGGRAAMVGFLRHLVEHYTFEPLGTVDFLGLFIEHTGEPVYADALDWLYDGQRDY